MGCSVSEFKNRCHTWLSKHASQFEVCGVIPMGVVSKKKARGNSLKKDTCAILKSYKKSKSLRKNSKGEKVNKNVKSHGNHKFR